MLAIVRGIGPKDEIEAMMTAQMAAVHMTTMTFARRLFRDTSDGRSAITPVALQLFRPCGQHPPAG